MKRQTLNSRFSKVLLLLFPLFCIDGMSESSKAINPEKILAQSDARIEKLFLAEKGQPLKRVKKGEPLKKGRPPFLRKYSYAMLDFAVRCLYLNEMIDEANDALAENAEPYLEIKDLVHDRDSFHWHGETLLRMVEMYGSKGHVAAGRLEPQVEKLILDCCWLYGKESSKLERLEIEKSKTWFLYSTENHHSMDFTIHWHFAKIAMDHPDYKNRKYDDGSTPAEQYKAYNRYFVHYALERAKRGICVEMRSDGYNTTWIKGLYNFFDYGEPKIKEASRMLMDLYFAYWAEEQIMGHMGGGKSRIRGMKWPKQLRDFHGNCVYAWVYFGIGKQPSRLYSHDFGLLLSSYRPPAVVADIALDHEGRGRYEVFGRAMGLGKNSNGHHLMSKVTAHEFDPKGGILRYSYCDPSFIIGSAMNKAYPSSAWVGISKQSRWQGIIFADEHDPRIVPLVRPKTRDTMNASWCLQSKGSLITHKLKDSQGAAEMIVWISKEGLKEPVKEGNLVFSESSGAFTAIRPGWGKVKLEEKRFGAKKKNGNFSGTPYGNVVTPEDPFIPMIVEVMSKKDVKSLKEFKAMVKANEPELKEGLLSYKTIYGDTLTLDTQYKKTPTINGKKVNYEPDMVYDSPFKHSPYLSGVVTIEKGERKLVLDFNQNLPK